jgi:NADPH:quinone reductase-like Zn-dependent oxidoreductase
MKAAIIDSYGGQDAVNIKDVDVPEPLVNEVQVDVYYASINPFDYKLRDGMFQDSIHVNFPLVLAGDVSGIVSAVGEGVTSFSVGQEVYGQANATKQGSLAEYTIVNTSQLALKPQVGFEIAASLPLVSASAYEAIHEHLNLKTSQKILIHGGAGGIGSMAIQIAKYTGAYVATTVSAKDKDYVKSIGADEAIDYKDQDFTELIHSFDAVFDTVGGETTEKSYTVLKPGGKLVSMASDPSAELEGRYDVKAIHMFTKTSSSVLSEVAKLVNNKKLAVNIDKTFDINQAAEALEYLKTGHPRGKIVIKIKI